MTDTTPDLVPHGARRLRRWRRRRRNEIITSIAIASVLIVAGLVATDTIRIPSSESKPALAEEAPSANASGTTSTGVTQAREKTPPRALSVVAPLKLWIGGDSLSWAPGISLGRLVEKTGVVAASLDSHVSTGLQDQQNLNWFRRATDIMNRTNPDQVIFTIGANDWTIVAANPKGVDGQPAWTAKWHAEVAQMMDILVGGSRERRVYWVGTPPMRATAMNQAVVQLNAIASSEAAKRPSITFIDGYKIFADSKSQYASSLPDPTTGKRMLLRAGDGIHFTGDGGDYMADELMRHLEADWHIARQAVSGHDHQLIQSRDTTPQPGRFIQSTRSTTTTTGRVAGSTTSTGAIVATSTTAAIAESSTTAAPVPTTTAVTTTTATATTAATTAPTTTTTAAAS